MKITKPKISLLLYLLLTLSGLQGQNEFRRWYFGSFAGLDFSSSPPTVMTNGIISTIEGCATICDAAGNLLFSTEGTGVANSANVVMANGTGLAGNGTSTQCVLIVKQPGNNNLYYIFVNWGILTYNVVDMNLAAGMGSVTVKNATVYNTGTCEKQVAIRHCNGKDVWIVSHEFGTNNFRSYLLTASGLNLTPVITSIGETPAGTGTAIGHLKVSPDGKKLAMATYSSSVPISLGNSGFHLFDFDASSGVVSNSLVLNNASTAYGVEFSADGTKLYGATSSLGGTTTANFYQWNICAPSNSAIIASQYSLNLGSIGAGSLQRAIDGKIYMAVTGSQSLNVINNPNASGVAMGFSLNALSIAPKTSRLGLPNFINLYTKPTPSPFTNTLACQKASFNVPPVPTFSSGCSSTPYAPIGYVWDFGEPASGSANSSTLSNPVHNYSTTGTYTVSLILLNACTNDTLKQVVNISTAGPAPAVTGPTLICKGDRYDYTASGGTSYFWSTNSTNTVVSLSPTQTTSYTLSASLNGCTSQKVFTVTVNPCLGIENIDKTGVWNIFPNPVTNELSIESAVGATLIIMDMNGALVIETKITNGLNKINTEQLKPGVYSIRGSSANGNLRTRLVKVE